MTRRAIPSAKTWSWLPARTCLVVFFAAQMALPWLTEFDFPRTGYLKSFGYSFVRLLHFMEKSDYITFLGTGKQVKYSSNIVN